MHERRVGTLTLGLLLLLTGVLYLAANVFNIPIDAEIIEFWPLVLISLGIEVLYYNHVCGKQNTTIKFSGLSLFLIIIVLFFSFGAFVFSKICNEVLDPNSPIYYRNYINHVSLISNFKNLC